MSWQSVKLEEVFDIARGGSPRPIADFITDEPDGLNWISIKDASNSDKYITKTKLKIRKEGLNKSRFVKEGDFLLTNSMSFGRPYIMKTTGCIHDGWLVLSGDKERINQDYFYHLFGSSLLHQLFSRLAAGAVVKNLNIDLVKGVEIPLPPLAEQQKIAAILDAADSLRQQDQQLIDHYTTLSQSLFLEMFGDPVTNLKGWKIKPLGDIFRLSSGKGLTAKDMDKNGRYPVYGGNGINGYHSEYIFKEPQLIIGRVGVYCGVIHITEPYSWVTDNAMYVKNKLKEFNMQFMAQLLELSNLNQYAGQAAQPLVSGSRIHPLEMIYPPIELQNKFAERIQAIEAQKQQAQASLEKSNALFNSLLQRAFNGELTGSKAA